MRAFANKIVQVIREAFPNSQELVKWGNLTYLVDGKEVAWILVYEEHVNLGIFQGARMKSPLLEGTGKGLKHIKVRRPGDMDEKEFQAPSCSRSRPSEISRSINSPPAH